MLLSELIADLGQWTEVVAGPDGGTDPDVGRVVSDSRHVRPGDAFCAIAGHDADGHRFIAKAIASGAAAVIAQDQADTGNVPLVRVADSRIALARLAHRALGDPSRDMTVVGITGTNGKTTISYLLEAIFAAAGHRCGVLGTIEYRLGDGRVVQRDTHVTTPGADELAEMFAEMRDAGIGHVAMEVSSHALDQHRTDGIAFDAAIFTNLTRDHGDYHPTEEHYRDAKARLFAGLDTSAVAVLNRDEAVSEVLAERTGAPVTWYGLSQAADVHGRIARIQSDGSEIELVLGEQAARSLRLPLVGRHNVANALAAAAAAWQLGIEPDAIVEGLESIAFVPGRLEPVRLPDGTPPPFTVLVDYAHTDDALRNVLSAARPLARDSRVILVFGCGGDRDRIKRPKMAEVAEELADLVVVTSDNPRTEDPESILDMIVAGFSEAGGGRVHRQVDRRKAIEWAIGQAGPGDIVLIAGKGHEDYQVLGREKIHFDDREVAAAALAGRESAARQ